MVIVEQATEEGTLKRNPTLYELILFSKTTVTLMEKRTWALLSNK